MKLKGKEKNVGESKKETETYKVAKQMLDKFGETNKKPSIAITDSATSISSKTFAVVPSTFKTNISGLRKRNIDLSR